MTIYETFVYPDKLISPINGYETKVITNQTIKQFGFSSKEELLDQFPGFPLCCDTIRNARRLNCSDLNMQKSITLQENYIKNMTSCTHCGKNLPYKKRGNKFCDKSCAASYNNSLMTPESRMKQAKSLSKTRLANSTSPRDKKESKQTKKESKQTKKENVITSCIVCEISMINAKRKTCSTTCHRIRLREIGSIGGRTSKANKCRRSKDEIKLFELCETEFACLANHVISDGWDADIVIPEHKLAILWNGPWHYKDMKMSNHSLKQVQNRDRIKTSLFESLGWTVLVYEDHCFTPESAFADIKKVAGAGFEPA